MFLAREVARVTSPPFASPPARRHHQRHR